MTERKWAQKGVDSGVHGLIAVNARAGGHSGHLDARALLDDIGDLGLPVICAGGIGTELEFTDVLRLGYAGVQMGTRFIATDECTASVEYKQAIVDAQEGDIVHSERLTGVPVAVIATPFIRRLGLRAGPVARWMLRYLKGSPRRLEYPSMRNRRSRAQSPRRSSRTHRHGSHHPVISFSSRRSRACSGPSERYPSSEGSHVEEQSH